MPTPAEQRTTDRACAARARRAAALATEWAREAEHARDEAQLRYELLVTRWLLRHPSGAISDRLAGRRGEAR
jgi:hypothetical protein